MWLIITGLIITINNENHKLWKMSTPAVRVVWKCKFRGVCNRSASTYAWSVLFCFVLFFSLLVLVTKLLAKLQPEVLNRSYSGNLRSLYALKDRKDKSNVTWFLRRPISAKICQYSRNRDRVCLLQTAENNNFLSYRR